MPRLTAARALTAHIAKRFVRIATIIALGVFLLVVVLCGVLAHFFSGWWWLLLIPFVFLLGIFLVVRLVVSFLIRRIHGDTLRPDQKKALDELTDKLERLIEARGTPPIFFVFISIKDLLLYRDVTTLKGIVQDSATLKRDYEKLEKLF
jgi:membrane protein implicated in regulation of membrane protease activity